jgi:hypothetical protein
MVFDRFRKKIMKIVRIPISRKVNNSHFEGMNLGNRTAAKEMPQNRLYTIDWGK